MGMQIQEERGQDPVEKVKSLYTDGFLRDEETDYRMTTDDAELAIQEDNLLELIEMANGYKPLKSFLNLVHFEETGYSQGGDSAFRGRDYLAVNPPIEGPLFYKSGELHEVLPVDRGINGIRFLGIALSAKADKCIGYLLANGAKIPGVHDFPKHTLDTRGSANVSTAAKKSERIKPLIVEYRKHLVEYLQRTGDSQVESFLEDIDAKLAKYKEK